MGLLKIPSEVIDCYVLPYLGWNDLLRFRRVCKWTKNIANGYLKVHPELAPEIEINEEKGFKQFLDMGIPTSKVYINNTSGDDFYTGAGDDASKFIETYGPLVRSLRVDQISVYICGKEWDFFDGLKNLKNLEATRYGGFDRRLDDPSEISAVMMEKKERFLEDPRTRKDGKSVRPDVFKRLTTIKVGNNEYEIIVTNFFEFVDSFLSTVVEYVSLPFNSRAQTEPEYDEVVGGNRLTIGIGGLMHCIGRRGKEENAVTNLKIVDFVNYHDYNDERERFEDERLGSLFFLMICATFIEKNVKLRNLGSMWFLARKHFSSVSSPVLGTPVLSLVNLHPCVLPLNMSNLEAIDIRATSQSSPGRNWREERPDWPALKTLYIYVDSREGHYYDWINVEPERVLRQTTSTKDLFSFFFQNVSRTAMTELRLSFTEDLGNFALKTEHIVSACPNLKKLTLSKCQGSSKAFNKLWSGLRGLKDVSLEYCKNLGDLAFVGEDSGSPVFLKLTKLRKLSLRGMDKMSITDALFSQVIRHLRLSHLMLTSDTPVKSVTIAGIRSLCDGVFAESVEKFPFQNWSLSGVSVKEFQKQEQMFRSFNML